MVVLGGIILTGYLWYSRRNQPAQLLMRAELALQARNYDKAIELTNNYIANYPDDWLGYYIQAKTYVRLGRYENARNILLKLQAQAETLKPDLVLTGIMLAQSYAFPAKQSLSAPDSKSQLSVLQTAVAQLRQANEILMQIKADKENDILDVKQSIGLNESDIGDVLILIADRFARDAEIADTAGMVQKQVDDDRRSTEARSEAQTVFKHAIQILLEVVTRDPSREMAANSIVSLCIEQGDRESLQTAQTAILAAEQTSPIAQAMLIMNELDTADEQLVYEQDEIQARRDKILLTAQKLDELLSRNPDKEYILLQRANLALQLSDFPTGKRLVDDILKENPRQGEARLIEARMLLLQGKTTEAEQKLFKLKAEFYRWPVTHYFYGRAASASGKKELARQAMRTAATVNPDIPCPEAHAFLADSLIKEGYYDQAFADAQAYWQARPSEPAAIKLYVTSAVQTDQPDLARQILENTRNDYSSDPTLLMFVSDGYALLNDRNEALQAAKSAADCTPATLMDRIAVAQAKLRLGKTIDAEKMFSEILSKNPKLSQVNFELGRIYVNTGRNLQALERFQEAIRLNSKNDEYRLALARVLLNIGEVAECEQVLESVDPAHARANLLRLQIKLLQGQPLDDEETLPPADATSGLNAALAYLKAGQPQRCLKICQAEMQKNPDDTDVRMLMGQAYLSLGDKDKSFEQWKTVLQKEPRQLANYLRLARLLRQDSSPDEVTTRLAAITQAAPDMISLTTGWLYESEGDPKRAWETYNLLAGDTAAPQETRNFAQLLLIRILAQQGQFEQALAQLNQVDLEKISNKRINLLKAQLLIAAKHTSEAGVLLANMKSTAVEKDDADQLKQIVRLYLTIKKTDEALAVSEEIQRLLPADPTTYLLRASVLRTVGKSEEAIESYRQAINCQPGNYGIYRTLANALDDQQEPQQALEVLEELENLSPVARSAALYERGNILSRWGLSTQAAECFEQLAQTGHGENPKIQMALGNSFARLGRKAQAIEILKKIPRYGDQYQPAQMMLVNLNEDIDQKLEILHQLQTQYPTQISVLLQTFNALFDADRAEESVTVFRSFWENYTKSESSPQKFDLPVLTALSRTQDQSSASALCLEVAQKTSLPHWSQLAVLLIADENASEVTELLPAVDQSSINDALLGFCSACRTNNDEAARLWTERINKLEVITSRRLPVSYKIFVSLATGATDQAQSELDRLTNANMVNKAVASELISTTQNQENRAEVVKLLRTLVALDMGVTTIARNWALEVLENRPTCQWAAALALNAGADKTTLRRLSDLLEPKDVFLAQAIKAELLMQENQHDQAAQIYERLTQAQPDNMDLLLNYGSVLENTGQLEKALEIYRNIWQTNKSPIAANNAAYVASKLASGDADQLNEAQELADNAVKNALNVPQFLDTRGWINYLRGNNKQACQDLHRVVKVLPISCEVHYHLGMAHLALEHKDLARWHLAAVTELAQKQQSDGQTPSLATTEAIKLAQQALTKME
jgi:tetratricopeptide (TPR) repeat protein